MSNQAQFTPNDQSIQQDQHFSLATLQFNSDSSLKQRIMEVVAQIPAGKVMYFGQIANYAGGTARTVGFILSGLTQQECDQIPWYRVVAKSGYISALKLGIKGIIQKEKLQFENYVLINHDFVDMQIHLWIN